MDFITLIPYENFCIVVRCEETILSKDFIALEVREIVLAPQPKAKLPIGGASEVQLGR